MVPMRKEDVTVEVVDDGLLVIDNGGHSVHRLNAFASATWMEVDGRRPVVGIARAVSRRLNVDVDDDAVEAALRRLARARLVAWDAPAARAPGLTRRDALRRTAVGLGALAALPMVTTLVLAPQRAGARSGHWLRLAPMCASQTNSGGGCTGSCSPGLTCQAVGGSGVVCGCV